MHRFLFVEVVLVAVVTGLVAGPAAASVPPPGSSLPSALRLPVANPPGLTTGQPAGDWRGRYCTTPSCTGGSSQPGSAALGFGSAVLAAGWIARRRRPLES